MKYKVGDRVKVIVYDGIEGTIIDIINTNKIYKYKIHFDEPYLLDALYAEYEIKPINEKFITNNFINYLDNLFDVLDLINKKLDLINKELNNIIKNIDNNK